MALRCYPVWHERVARERGYAWGFLWLGNVWRAVGYAFWGENSEIPYSGRAFEGKKRSAGGRWDW